MANQLNAALPPGTRLGRWQIERTLSTGGFSIVYLGRAPDGAPMAIKEYMPCSTPARPKGLVARCDGPEAQKRFDIGLRDFFREAEALSRIDSPTVARALDFFVGNGTAYLVMPFEHGRTLRAHAAAFPEGLDDAALQRIFHDALLGLKMLHEHQILHLDLKPSNLWIRANGSAMILDFGTARIGAPDPSAPPPFHTPGFSAPEQRRPVYRPELLGPWTDFYNLAATLYACLEGAAPPVSDERREKDKIRSLSDRWLGRASEPLLAWADRALRLEHRERPQTADEGLAALASYSAQPERQVFWEWASDASPAADPAWSEELSAQDAP
jgi:serine/threonine protein kinase